MPKDHGIGAPLKRREDVRFLTGKGRYTDDINRPGQAYVHFLRSDVAHGRITRLDTAKAAAMPGVLRVFTGDDFRDAGSLPCAWAPVSRDGSAQQEPRHPILAEGVVCHVGEAIAGVVAETYAQARDAAEAIELDIEELPAVLDMKRGAGGGLAQGAREPDLEPLLRLGLSRGQQGGGGRRLRDGASRDHARARQQPLVANPMEPRCAVAEYDAGTDEYTLFTTSQNPHVIRLMMGAFVLHIPERKLRVVAPDVGGGFGSKIMHYGEEAFVTRAAQVLGRPVKWTSSRSEAFVTDAQGRDHVTTDPAGAGRGRHVPGVPHRDLANLGAYLRLFSTVTPTYLHGPAAGGPYRTPLAYVNVKGVFTNTVPVDAYRGAGRPEGTFQLERVVDKAAREMGIDQVEIRRKNFVRPEEFPYQTPLAVVYDSGNYHATLDKLLEISDHAGFPARRAEAAGRGKLRGFGFATWVEASGLAPSQLIGTLGRPRRALRGGDGPGEPHRRDQHLHRQPQPRPGARDRVRADRRRPAGDRRGHDRGGARRHRAHPVRDGHLRVAVGRGRRLGDPAGDRQGDREGEEVRGAPDGGVRHRHRGEGRAFRRGRHRPVAGLGRGGAGGLCAAQLSGREHGAGAGGDGVLRSVELRLSRPAPMAARSRSIRRRAPWRSSGSGRRTTSGW